MASPDTGICGIICEYNPFHLGHARHLAACRAGGGPVVAVMSTCFVQRGLPAMFDVESRVRMALSAGVDAVFALPAAWALRDAEHFARYGVTVLDALGCGTLAFGAETDDLGRLTELAECMNDPPSAWRTDLRDALGRGVSFPAAVESAVAAHRPDLAPLLRAPNNTLALAYLRECITLGSRMKPLLVPRSGGYHETALQGSLSSASAIRSSVLRGDWAALTGTLPAASLSLVREAAWKRRIVVPEALSRAVLYRLWTMSDDEYRALPDQAEGLPDRLKKAAYAADSLDALLSRAATRRYTRPRISRLIFQAALGMTQAQCLCPVPDSVLLLGLRRGSEGLLHRLSRGRVRIIGRPSLLVRESHPVWETEKRAWDLWELGCGGTRGSLFRYGVVRQ